MLKPQLNVIAVYPGNQNRCLKLEDEAENRLCQLYHIGFEEQPVLENNQFKLNKKLIRIIQEDVDGSANQHDFGSGKLPFSRLALNPLESLRIDANVLRDRLISGDIEFKMNEAKEQLYATFNECLAKKPQFEDSMLETSDTQVIRKMRDQCYFYDIVMLPEMRLNFQRIPRNNDGSQLVANFVLQVMTTVVVVLFVFMRPHSQLREEKYYQNEQTLFKANYDPTCQNTVLTDADKHFGVKTFFGCAYQLLLDLRNWFETNRDQLYQFLVEFMRRDLHKVEIENMTEEESKNETFKKQVRLTACSAYAAGWIRLIDNMVNQDIVIYVKQFQEKYKKMFREFKISFEWK